VVEPYPHQRCEGSAQGEVPYDEVLLVSLVHFRGRIFFSAFKISECYEYHNRGARSLLLLHLMVTFPQSLV
jgi:hypothetical protein